LNRLSLSRDQISNQGSLDFLMKKRTLKSFAATAIGKYVKNSDLDEQMQFVKNLERYLLIEDIEYVGEHAYNVKEIMGRIKYCLELNFKN